MKSCDQCNFKKSYIIYIFEPSCPSLRCEFGKNGTSFFLYFRAFFSFPSMFTFIVIYFCSLNLVINVSLKILDDLGWKFIFRLYLCNTLFQQNFEQIEHHLKKSYIIYIFAPSCTCTQCLHSSSYAFADGILCSTYL